MTSPSIHEAVMSREIIELLAVRPGGRYIDATLGGGTHTTLLLEQSEPDGHVLSLDLDPKALERAAETFASYGDRWRGVETNFRSIASVAKEQGFDQCDGILFDLGLSSDELADPKRGLSFQIDGLLDMRLGLKANEDGLMAADIVNSWSLDEIEELLRVYGEERYARRIAEGIVKARRAARIIGTFDLAAVIRTSVPALYERGRIHPATRTFQALRIAVNDELGALKQALHGAREILAPHGRMAVLSFHSLEDRIVKQAFREAEDLNILTKKPLIPSQEECLNNPRARSAKLRGAQKHTPKNLYVTSLRPGHDSPT